MAEFPALTLWTDAYLSDTRHLSTLEHGAYLLLLMEAWRRPYNVLPGDDTTLARLAGLTLAEWLAIRDVIIDRWSVNADGSLQPNRRYFYRGKRKSIPISVISEVWDRDGEQCRYCGTDQGPFELDHIFPWSRGGADTADNLCIACVPCNRKKRDRTPEEMGWSL